MNFKFIGGRKMKKEWKYWSKENFITTFFTAVIVICAWVPIFFHLAVTLPYSELINFFVMLPFLGLCMLTILIVKWIVWELFYGKWRKKFGE